MNDLTAHRNRSAALKAELKKIEAAKKDAKKLRALLLEAMNDAADPVIRMATIVGYLRDLEEDLGDLKISILPMLLRVADGQVIPELVSHLRGRWRLLNRACNLPKPDQQKIVDNVPLKVIELGGGHRMIKPLDLSDSEICQTVGRDHIKDDAEQATWLREREQRQPKRGVANDNGVVLEPAHNRIRVTGDGVVITLHDLLEYAARLSDLKNKGK